MPAPAPQLGTGRELTRVGHVGVQESSWGCGPTRQPTPGCITWSPPLQGTGARSPLRWQQVRWGSTRCTQRS